jgi:hypothetical protein
MTAPLKQQKVEQTSVCPLDLADETPELVASQDRTEPMEGGRAGLGKGRGQCSGSSWAAWVVRFASLDALKSKTVTAFDIGRDRKPADQGVGINDPLNLQGKSFMTAECHLEIALPLVKVSCAPTAQRPTSS